MRSLAFGKREKFRRIDADWADQDAYTALSKAQHVAVGRGSHLDRREVAKRLQPLLCVEADYIVGEKLSDQILCLRQGREQTARRPRCVEEEPNSVFDPALAELSPERDHVIVLHPNRVIGFDQRPCGVGETLVGALVTASKSSLIFRQVDPIVE